IARTSSLRCRCFFFTHAATTAIYPLSLHDALPIFQPLMPPPSAAVGVSPAGSVSVTVTVPLVGAKPLLVTRIVYVSAASPTTARSEEHTSELQSRGQLVCRLLLEKKKTTLHTQVLV